MTKKGGCKKGCWKKAGFVKILIENGLYTGGLKGGVVQKKKRKVCKGNKKRFLKKVCFSQAFF